MVNNSSIVYRLLLRSPPPTNEVFWLCPYGNAGNGGSRGCFATIDYARTGGARCQRPGYTAEIWKFHVDLPPPHNIDKANEYFEPTLIHRWVIAKPKQVPTPITEMPSNV